MTRMLCFLIRMSLNCLTFTSSLMDDGVPHPLEKQYLLSRPELQGLIQCPQISSIHLIISQYP